MRHLAKLFAEVLGNRAKPKVIACGSRSEALADFENGRRESPSELCILVVDSEGPVRDGISPWEHVLQRTGDQWQRPDGVTDDHLHLMVQMMEAWLVADPEALANYYGQGFNPGALPVHSNVEQVSKADLMTGLENATRNVKVKGKSPYQKSHAFDLIACLAPSKTAARAPRARRLFDFLRETLPSR